MPSSETFPRNRFATLLGVSAAPGAFSARCTARPDDLRLEVREVGPIVFPVSQRQAKELCVVGRPARFGKGEQTLLDPAVRDTWEIPKSRVKIDKRQWNATLGPVLDRLAEDLGLPPECKLTAELHSMLVYAPGQFFAPHQDSEKADNMIGTLVVTLPSGSTGGEFEVEHAGRKVTYRPSAKLLSFVAFYADCRHQVRPVTSGYRVVLTYNLLLQGDTAAASAGRTDAGATAELASCLHAHFGDSDEPSRLVYLLDHEYTQRGLGWARLKGSDASRAAMVRAAADAADCEATLALAEIQETWSAYEDDPSWDWRGHYHADDEQDYDGSSGDYHLEELIESEIRLDCWLNDSGEVTPASLAVHDDEVCATTPTADLSPHESSYEGYMGNYGNTLDRWYRRAAIVLWPRRWHFAIRAEASPGWALDTLADQVRAGDLAGAREGAASLASFWANVVREEELLGKALDVARSLDDPGTAAMLLAPFPADTINKTHAAAVAEVAARYGQPWTVDLVKVWFGQGRPPYGMWMRQPTAWTETLPTLCDALCAAGEAGRSTGRLLQAAAWARLRKSAEHALRMTPPSHCHKALDELGPSMAGMLVSTAITSAADLHAEVVAFLCRQDDDLITCAMSALRTAGKAKPKARNGSAVDAVARHWAARLEERLARPARASDDWSIGLPGGCSCELCATLGAFLGDRARRSFEWPLAAPGRGHVHERINAAELPVDHQTRRSGRPYTLVLKKTEALFERERQERLRDRADLAWLRRTARPA